MRIKVQNSAKNIKQNKTNSRTLLRFRPGFRYKTHTHICTTDDMSHPYLTQVGIQVRTQYVL